MKAYISVSFNKRKSLDREIQTIINTLKDLKIIPLVFVDHYKFDSTQQRQMMQQAITDIDQCDLLLAETSDKGIGIGIEVGYAKAKNKPIVYLRQESAEHSTTVAGISDFQIIYKDTLDLQEQLIHVLKAL